MFFISSLTERSVRRKQRYSRVISWFTGHSRFVFIPVIIMFVSSLFEMRFIPKTFLPEPKEGIIEISIGLAPGTGLEFTDSLLVSIEGRIIELIEPGDLANSYLNVGKQEGMGATTYTDNNQEYDVNLRYSEEGRSSIEALSGIIAHGMPLAIGATESSVVWAPMARTVAGVLVVATLLTLVVLPSLYVKLDR